MGLCWVLLHDYRRERTASQYLLAGWRCVDSQVLALVIQERHWGLTGTSRWRTLNRPLDKEKSWLHNHPKSPLLLSFCYASVKKLKTVFRRQTRSLWTWNEMVDPVIELRPM